MRLSVSNIAWDEKNDYEMYALLEKYRFEGLEIAPTRIFPEHPYDRLKEAGAFSSWLYEKYGLVISSMQSILYGRSERIFGSDKERTELYDYMLKAIDFAGTINCGNLVFGCPKNRVLMDGEDPETAVKFFNGLAEYAASRNTTIGFEANPVIYNTNFINDTASAFEFIKKVMNHEVNVSEGLNMDLAGNTDDIAAEDAVSIGLKVNLDLGTMIFNHEDADIIRGKVYEICHVHISEPQLKPIEKRKLHEEIRDILISEDYKGFISIEMGKCESIYSIEETMDYIKETFS